jgi:hypothetical protein
MLLGGMSMWYGIHNIKKIIKKNALHDKRISLPTQVAGAVSSSSYLKKKIT